MEEACGFVQAEHDVHVLYRAAGLALDQVVDQADNDQLSGALIHIQGKITEVAAAHVGADLRFFRPEHPDEDILFIEGPVGLLHFLEVAAVG